MSEELPPAPPPDDLPDLQQADLAIVPSGTLWARIYHHVGRHPVAWDEPRTRSMAKPGRFDPFDPADPPGAAPQSVMYVALPDPPHPDRLPAPMAGVLYTVVAEVGQANGPTTPTLDRLTQWSLVIARLDQQLELLDLDSDWSMRAHAGSHLSTAPRVETSAWAFSIATRWPELAGVTYRPSTRPPGRAAALWRPASDVVAPSSVELVRELSDPSLRPALESVAVEIGVVVDWGAPV